MHNETLLVLLADSLPDGNHVFDVVFEKSGFAAVCLLFAIVGCLAAWILWKQLKDERKEHRDDCAAKDQAIKDVNEQFRSEMRKNIEMVGGLIGKLEEGNKNTAEILTEVLDVKESMKNGLRALGNALSVPSERMNID